MEQNLIESAKSFFNVSDLKALKEPDPDSGFSLFQYVLDEDIAEVSVEFMLELEKVNDPCCDNYRIFPEDMYDEYQVEAMQGCCGSQDSTFKTTNGNTYLLGFNYGH